MKFVLAPDSFKESMSSIEVCNSMERAIKKVIKDAEVISVPMADGGEGTVEALISSNQGNYEKVNVTSPIEGIKVEAEYGVINHGKTAIIEMASAAGLCLIDAKDRNPLITTTFGVGEIILDALNKGAKNIILGIGGSATNDGGAGMMQALGARFLDEDNKEIPFGGEGLLKLKRIDLNNLDSRLANIKFEVACDVTNPLIGKDGATNVFGAQKGGRKEMLETLEMALTNYSEVIKREIGFDVSNIEGAGAAGGLGAGLISFLNAELKRGIDIVIKHTSLEEKIKGADFVFTGEGSIDGQTLFGKTITGVAGIAKKNNIKTIAFAGKISDGAEKLYDLGVNSMFSIVQGTTYLENALKDGAKNMEKTVENVIRTLI